MNPDVKRLLQGAAQIAQLARSGDFNAASAALQAHLTARLPAGQSLAASRLSQAWAGVAQAARAASTANPSAGDQAMDVQAHQVNAKPASGGGGGGGQFISGSYADASSQRHYKLYVPPGAAGQPMPLVVMLHGCTQNADDFAAGTAMNTLACAQGFLVLYPEQSSQANPQRCWNWFKHTHQARGRGEPALIAGMTHSVMARYPVDNRRVYVAGLSAGGAMAAIMGKTYPDVYAATGVHSGLAAGVATDVQSALSAMATGPASSVTSASQNEASARGLPTIVFHGDADSTVHPANGEQVVRSAAAASASVDVSTVTPAAGQRSSVRRVYRATDGSVLAELWLVHGSPHAWSGGSSQGSYTDPRGPNASAEMLRFFMAHARTA